jgi:hypothetical protein
MQELLSIPSILSHSSSYITSFSYHSLHSIGESLSLMPPTLLALWVGPALTVKTLFLDVTSTHVPSTSPSIFSPLHSSIA